METSYLPALAFSGADLLHGPLAMTDPDVPVLAVVGSGPGGRSMGEVLPRLGERRADVVVVGSADVPGGRPARRCPRSTSGTRRCWTSCRCSGWRWRWRWPGARTRTRRAG